MEICIDFDGTCVTHEYPLIGGDIGAIPVLKRLIDKGHELILFTMRSGKELDEAVGWFYYYNIPLYGINSNPYQKRWTDSPKAYGQLYIDDASLGIPLVYSLSGGRSYVNWKKVEGMLTDMGVL